MQEQNSENRMWKIFLNFVLISHTIVVATDSVQRCDVGLASLIASCGVSYEVNFTNNLHTLNVSV